MLDKCSLHWVGGKSPRAGLWGIPHLVGQAKTRRSYSASSSLEDRQRLEKGHRDFLECSSSLYLLSTFPFSSHIYLLHGAPPHLRVVTMSNVFPWSINDWLTRSTHICKAHPQGWIHFTPYNHTVRQTQLVLSPPFTGTDTGSETQSPAQGPRQFIVLWLITWYVYI